MEGLRQTIVYVTNHALPFCEDTQVLMNMDVVFEKGRDIVFFFQIIAIGFLANYCDNLNISSSLVVFARLLLDVVAAVVTNSANNRKSDSSLPSQLKSLDIPNTSSKRLGPKNPDH